MADVIMCLAEFALPQCGLCVKAVGDHQEIVSEGIGITSSHFHS